MHCMVDGGTLGGRSKKWSTSICLFLYVPKSANESTTRISILRLVSWTDNTMNYTDAYYVCNQSTGEVDSKLPHCSLEWQQLSVHEACSSCAAIRPIYNLPGEVHRHVIMTDEFDRCSCI